MTPPQPRGEKSKVGMRYTPEEDLSIWRFALQEHKGYGTVTMWNLYKEHVKTDRTVGTLNFRFKCQLMSRLNFTKFHVGTKLHLLKKYKVVLEGEFFNELSKFATIEMNNDRHVTNYTLHPWVGENRDMFMNDKDLMELTAPVSVKQIRFTPDEDKEIWEHVRTNYKSYSKGSETFWRPLIEKMNSKRMALSFVQRFHKIMAPKIHRTPYDMETKLTLYKACQVPLDSEFLIIAKKFAELELDNSGCLVEFDMFGRERKRKLAEKEANGNAKHQKMQDESSGFNPFFNQYPPIMMAPNGMHPGLPGMHMGHPTQHDFYQNIEHDSTPSYVRESSQLMEPKVEEVEFEPSPHFDINYDEDKLTPNEAQFEYDVDDEDTNITPMVNGHQHQKQESESSVDQTKVLEEMRKMKKDMEGMIGRVGKSLEDSMERNITIIGKSMNSMQEEMKVMRSETKRGFENSNSNAEDKTRTRKEYLTNLKKLVSSMESPEMQEIEERIEKAIQSVPEDAPLPLRLLRSVFDAGLTMIGH